MMQHVLRLALSVMLLALSGPAAAQQPRRSSRSASPGSDISPRARR